MVLITNLISAQTGTITAGLCAIDSKRAIKYLGVMIDDRLSFTAHVDYACKRASKATTALSRAMSNNSAIHSSRRWVLKSVTSFILRYGAAAWKAALGRKCNLQKRLMTFSAADLGAFPEVTTVACRKS
ncbi:uncharacterized protein LOC129759413 [Uranotaenia lowii]|uniref:uncharacterized protein LOC129759413 n=1 Tax=Uranotaenia lowii TaxID=190385 RepID=UPI00247A6F98|nr:uncharacterized protein LOC129759413 [Uranotaenia lowii]